MQKMIWIPDSLVDEIKEEAYKSRKSFSRFLVDLYLERHTTGPKISNLELAKRIVSSTDIYSEEYRKKNPMENCKVCGKALKFNCGH
jgi:hypothetical protein